MRLLDLDLNNVGPFDRASMRFLEDSYDARTLALVTGENGTGKTVLVDAIRATFGPFLARLERDIRRTDARLDIRATIATAQGNYHVALDEVPDGSWSWPKLRGLALSGAAESDPPPPWVLDYWSSQLATDPVAIGAIQRDTKRAPLSGALQGTYRNVDVVQQLCFLDYLRDSRDSAERAAGEALWRLAERIVASSLLRGGRLSHVERATFTPMVEQAGHVVPLSNLSSGNAYLIGRMLTLLDRMYAITQRRKEDPAQANLLPGLLLIDEAENHLHPEWQKRFLPTVLEMFPNLQIIATTHSPFVLASVPDARVFVCRYDEERRTCTVTEEPGDYGHAPVDQILASAAFDGTQPFGPEITALLQARDAARDKGDDIEVRRTERELKALNPTYFGYLDVEERIRALQGSGK